MVILLRFNQPVRPADVAPHIAARFEPHPWDVPVLPAEGLARLKIRDPSSVQRFNAKVAATSAVAGRPRRSPCGSPPTGTRSSSRRHADLVVSRRRPRWPPRRGCESVARCHDSLAGGCREAAPRDRYIIKVEPAFFVNGFHCTRACDGGRRQPAEFRVPGEGDGVRAARCRRRTSPIRGQFVPVAKASTPRPRPDFATGRGPALTLEDAGFDRQPPARTFASPSPRLANRPTARRSATPGRASVENWHQRAFTSFGDGHGVWEKDGGDAAAVLRAQLPHVTQWAQRSRSPI